MTPETLRISSSCALRLTLLMTRLFSVSFYFPTFHNRTKPHPCNNRQQHRPSYQVVISTDTRGTGKFYGLPLSEVPHIQHNTRYANARRVGLHGNMSAGLQCKVAYKTSGTIDAASAGLCGMMMCAITYCMRLSICGHNREGTMRTVQRCPKRHASSMRSDETKTQRVDGLTRFCALKLGVPVLHYLPQKRPGMPSVDGRTLSLSLYLPIGREHRRHRANVPTMYA